MTTAPLSGLRERERLVNGVRLHCVEAGPEGGLPVLLLHGFPEFWRAWERQIGPLARAGFHVVVPDLRGYNLSEKPAGVESYRLSTLVEDIVGLIHDLGTQRAHVVGHDWGGIIAWALAITRPEVVDKLVILNAPHPAAYRREWKRGEQPRRSWYVAFFQLPWLPERLLPRFGRWALRGRSGSYTPEDLRHYEAAWAQPGAATAMIHYYRALMRFGNVRETEVRAPTLLLWGERDVALVPELAEGLGEWVPDLRVVRFPAATHWLMRDETLRVGGLILDFLDRPAED